MTNSLNNSIMRRVYLIWLGRLLLNRTTLKLVALFALSWELAAVVVIRAVFTNGAPSHSLVHAFSYWMHAFISSSHHITQALVLGMFVLMAWLFLDAIHNLFPRTSAYRA